MHFSELFDYYGEALSAKQRDIFDMYYNADLSLSEIAENTGITRQGVRDFIKRAEQQLLEFESALGFYSKCAELKSAANRLEITPENSKIIELINNL